MATSRELCVLIRDYSLRHCHFSVVQELHRSKRALCTDPDVPQILLACNTIHHLIHMDSTAIQLETVIKLIDCICTNVSNVVGFQLYGKLTTALRMKLVMSELQRNAYNVLMTLNTYVPWGGLKVAASNKKHELWLNSTLARFQKFFLSLLEEDSKCRQYFESEYDEEFGPEFMDHLRTMTDSFLKKVTSHLPLTALDMILQRQKDLPLDSCRYKKLPGTVRNFLKLIHGKDTLTEPDLKELLDILGEPPVPACHRISAVKHIHEDEKSEEKTRKNEKRKVLSEVLKGQGQFEKSQGQPLDLGPSQESSGRSLADVDFSAAGDDLIKNITSPASDCLKHRQPPLSNARKTTGQASDCPTQRQPPLSNARKTTGPASDCPTQRHPPLSNARKTTVPSLDCHTHRQPPLSNARKTTVPSLDCPTQRQPPLSNARKTTVPSLDCPTQRRPPLSNARKTTVPSLDCPTHRQPPLSNARKTTGQASDCPTHRQPTSASKPSRAPLSPKTIKSSTGADRREGLRARSSIGLDNKRKPSRSERSSDVDSKEVKVFTQRRDKSSLEANKDTSPSRPSKRNSIVLDKKESVPRSERCSNMDSKDISAVKHRRSTRALESNQDISPSRQRTRSSITLDKRENLSRSDRSSTVYNKEANATIHQTHEISPEANPVRPRTRSKIEAKNNIALKPPTSKTVILMETKRQSNNEVDKEKTPGSKESSVTRNREESLLRPPTKRRSSVAHKVHEFVPKRTRYEMVDGEKSPSEPQAKRRSSVTEQGENPRRPVLRDSVANGKEKGPLRPYTRHCVEQGYNSSPLKLSNKSSAVVDKEESPLRPERSSSAVVNRKGRSIKVDPEESSQGSSTAADRDDSSKRLEKAAGEQNQKVLVLNSHIDSSDQDNTYTALRSRKGPSSGEGTNTMLSTRETTNAVMEANERSNAVLTEHLAPDLIPVTLEDVMSISQPGRSSISDIDVVSEATDDSGMEVSFSDVASLVPPSPEILTRELQLEDYYELEVEEEDLADYCIPPIHRFLRPCGLGLCVVKLFRQKGEEYYS